MDRQQEAALLEAFRALDEATQRTIVKFTQGQAAKRTVVRKPCLRVISGGRVDLVAGRIVGERRVQSLK